MVCGTIGSPAAAAMFSQQGGHASEVVVPVIPVMMQGTAVVVQGTPVVVYGTPVAVQGTQAAVQGISLVMPGSPGKGARFSPVVKPGPPRVEPGSLSNGDRSGSQKGFMLTSGGTRLTSSGARFSQ